MIEPVALFEAEIVRVRTMADGSPRFEFGAGESANEYLSILAKLQANNKSIQVIVYDYEDFEKLKSD